MNLKQLSNQSLLSECKRVAEKEREFTTLVLWHLREIETRKLFVTLGYTSLFEYTTKELRYSESSAMRRINAMRLLKEIPKVEDSLKGGKLSISQLSSVQSFLKAEKKEEGRIYSSEEKLELVLSVEGKSQRETEKVLFNKAPDVYIKTQEKIKAITESTSKVEAYLDQRVLDKLEKVRELASHKVKSNSIAELIEFLADQVIEQHAKNARNPRRMASPTSQVDQEQTAPPVERSTRFIPVLIKQELSRRSQNQCEYIDVKTRIRCDCRRYLQIDHIKPLALGGATTISNLRVLCRAHNQRRAVETFGNVER